MTDRHKDTNHSKECGHCGCLFYRDKRNTWAYWDRARFCSRDCFGAYNGAMKRAVRQSREDAFNKWIDKAGDCWIWTGAINDKRGGYGVFSYAQKTRGAHVVALEFDGRPVPKGMYACHRCDNPACVNPGHLYVGTPSDNVRDMLLRGRNQHGEAHYAAKLTEADVVSIRHDVRKASKIAVEYGVTESNIHAVKSLKTWKHVG